MEKNSKRYLIVQWISNLLLMGGSLLVIYDFGPIVYDNLGYYARKYLKQNYVLKYLPTKETQPTKEAEETTSVFSNLLASKSIDLNPVNYDFSLVIEKIGLKAPIIYNVPVNDPKKYMKALKDGIAHASVSDLPSESPGNTYLFAHSSLSFNLFGKYTNAFNLLDKLQKGDKVHVFYNNKDYTYTVRNSEILPGWNTRPLERSVVSPVLTLQSCFPPGTTLNRIIITSELSEVRDLDSALDNK